MNEEEEWVDINTDLIKRIMEQLDMVMIPWEILLVIVMGMLKNILWRHERKREREREIKSETMENDK